MADKEAPFVQYCGITQQELQQLRDVMFKSTEMNMSITDVRPLLMPLVYQHTYDDDLHDIFFALHGTGIAMSRADAIKSSFALASRHAEPSLVAPLYEVLSQTVKMPVKEAQQMTLKLALAGADADELKKSYLSDQQLDWAVELAVNAHLSGHERRYTKDLNLLNSTGFKKYYSQSWLDPWVAAPQEMRSAGGVGYRADEFYLFFKGGWQALWDKSPVTKQQRIVNGAKNFTMEQLKDSYGDVWQGKWFESYEISATRPIPSPPPAPPSQSVRAQLI